MPRQTIHPALTAERVTDAVEREMTTLDNPGFCIHCGEEHFAVEPDARNYHCDCCGFSQVFGAAELLMMIV